MAAIGQAVPGTDPDADEPLLPHQHDISEPVAGQWASFSELPLALRGPLLVAVLLCTFFTAYTASFATLSALGGTL